MAATQAKIPAITRYGIFTVAATDASDCVLVKMKALPITGVTTAPTELKDWERFSLRSALSGGPRTVTYGFAATSRKLWPHAKTNSANRKNPNHSSIAAGMKSSAPLEQIRSPVRIPRLYPIRFINRPAGHAARKYPPKNAT